MKQNETKNRTKQNKIKLMIVIKYHTKNENKKIIEKLKPRKTSNANEKQSLISNQAILSLFPSSSVQPAFPLLYMLIMMPYLMGQPFGQLGSVALTVSPQVLVYPQPFGWQEP